MAESPPHPDGSPAPVPTAGHAPSPATWTAVAALWGRAAEQTRDTPLIRDPVAAAWLEQLGFDTSRLASATATRVAVCARAQLIDEWVAAWAGKQTRRGGHARGLIIELGVGFSTRAYRLAELGLDFLGVDQADTVRHRAPLAAAQLGRTLLADVTEAACIDAIANAATARPVCFVAEGLFMYLEPAQVQTLLARLAAAYPGAALLFGAYAPPARRLQRFHDSLGPLGSALRSTWHGSPHVQLLETRTLRDDSAAFRRLPLVYRFPGVHRLHATRRAVLTAQESAR